MKKIPILLLLLLITGCGYGMKYTKSVPPVPPQITSLKVAKIDEIKIVGRSGEVILQGKADFIRNFLVNEISSSYGKGSVREFKNTLVFLFSILCMVKK